MPTPEPLHVVWYKRDLRTVDHRPLAGAVATGAPVLPLYVVEPDYWRQPDAAARQWAFAAESLAELSARLTALGQPLIVRSGCVVAVLDDIRRRHGLAAVWSHEETGNAWTYARDLRLAAFLRAHAIPWHEARQFGVIRRLKDRNGWARQWDRQMAEAVTPEPRALPPLGLTGEAIPTAAALGLAADPCPGRQTGGRSAGMECLDTFLAGRGRDYRRQMSNPLAGAAACSRLSPHLAWGTLSMREVAQAAQRRLRELQSEPGAEERALRASLSSFTGRLHWHCHFMQKLESEPAIEWREIHPAARGLRPVPADPRLLAAWAAGETGFPFLDACMRSLTATGWLNFRMRAMVMSFASYNLWLPWQETGLHLARMFTDYEPGIHWPQAQMQSGATGINTIRIYSVVKQGHDQDPTGEFVRRWVPELASVPDRHLQEPWSWDGFQSIADRRYPRAIVDLKASSALAKERIYGLRRQSEFHAAADAIQDKHGSRRSGIAMTGAGRRKSAAGSGHAGNSKRRRGAGPQLEFDL